MPKAFFFFFLSQALPTLGFLNVKRVKLCSTIILAPKGSICILHCHTQTMPSYSLCLTIPCKRAYGYGALSLHDCMASEDSVGLNEITMGGWGAGGNSADTFQTAIKFSIIKPSVGIPLHKIKWLRRPLSRLVECMFLWMHNSQSTPSHSLGHLIEMPKVLKILEF